MLYKRAYITTSHSFLNKIIRSQRRFSSTLKLTFRPWHRIEEDCEGTISYVRWETVRRKERLRQQNHANAVSKSVQIFFRIFKNVSRASKIKNSITQLYTLYITYPHITKWRFSNHLLRFIVSKRVRGMRKEKKRFLVNLSIIYLIVS